MLTTEDRFNILDCEISAANPGMVIEAVRDRIKSEQGGYICFSNVHTVVTSKKDVSLRESTNKSFLSLPDGKPLSIYANLKGLNNVKQVAGPDFMPLCIKEFPGAKHYFYGSTQSVLDRLHENLLLKYPDICIAGMFSPPFRELSDSEIKEIRSNIHSAKPDFVWVGLGAPKQEIWMMENYKALSPVIMLGVGAAFDFHAGVIQRSPNWVRKLSLEWLHRLSQEPGRLWKRYTVTNSLFLYYLLLDSVKKRFKTRD